MANISQVRGALLEEAVLFLLNKFGYQTIEAPLSHKEVGLRGGHSGMEVRGRGAWHQIDALAEFNGSPAFMYPLRLMVEAKCYQEQRTVGIEVVRNAVGVLKDISENYFSLKSPEGEVQIPRYNYHAAVFSTSGYTKGAIDYALAHQVFLIQYQNVPIIQPLIDAIMQFDETCITSFGKSTISEVRRRYRSIIRNQTTDVDARNFITERGLEQISGSLIEALHRIGGSYFGMLQGRWPMHLLTSTPLSANAFLTDTVKCKVTGRDSNKWKFIPSEIEENDANWFEIEFNLPEGIAILVAENRDDPIDIASIKQQHFSYIDLTGQIGGIQRNVRLEVDQDWIVSYIQRLG